MLQQKTYTNDGKNRCYYTKQKRNKFLNEQNINHGDKANELAALSSSVEIDWSRGFFL